MKEEHLDRAKFIFKGSEVKTTKAVKDTLEQRL